MKKYIAFSAVAATLLMAGGDVQPVEPVVAASSVDMGTVFGQARAFYVDRTYEGGINNNRNALAIGGYVGYTTPDFSGLKFTVAAYGTYGFDIHDTDMEGAGTSEYSYALTGRAGENYIFLGQAYLDYTAGKTNVKIGRQKLDTPMAGSDDARMLPNLFEAAVVTNTSVENTTLVAAHVTKMTVGTFGNIYAGGELGMYSGYGKGMNAGLSGDFVEMGAIANSSLDTDGVTAVAAIHKYDNGATAQLWDYYAYDILNVVYAQADMPWNCMLNPDVKMVGSLQYINESDVGTHAAFDGNYWGAQLSATLGNFNAKGSYSQSNDSGILAPWGGMPAFTQGMVTRHQFLPNTDAWKVSGTYNFADLNLNASVYYSSYDVGTTTTALANAGYQNLDSSEYGFDLIYQATSDLQLRFRGNFPREFGTYGGNAFDWDEYRLIANYNF
jgi:hypothetical protein